MSQRIPGGRAALDRLIDDLNGICKLAEEAAGAVIRNPLYAKDRAEEIQQDIHKLKRFVNDRLDPMLMRRDRTGQNDIDDLLARIAEIERWRAEQDRKAEQERERGPVRLRKVE